MMGDGTYKFHAEGGRATPPHEGTITAANGRWTLHTLKGLSKDYSDGGSYEIHDTIAVITGKLGTGSGAWSEGKLRCPTAAKVSNLRFQGKVRKFPRHIIGHFSNGNMRVRIFRGQPGRRSAKLPKRRGNRPELPAFRAFDFVSALPVFRS
jgi:hypothetical protein